MSWQTDLLSQLGAPATPANISFLSAWSQREGANDYNNPLNITGPAGYGGATGFFNSAHVLEFPSLSLGTAATANFLEHGYGSIISALKSGDPYGAPGVASDLSAWSGGAYSSLGHASPSAAPSSEPGFNPLTTLAGPLGIFLPQGKPSPQQLAESTPSWLAALLVPFSEWWKAHPIALLLVALFVGAIAIAVVASDHTDEISGAAKGAAVAA